MSIRTTVTLDEDVHERVKHESRLRGTPFRQTLNELLRTALVAQREKPNRHGFRVKATHMGLRRDLNLDCTEALLEYLDGPGHR